MRSTNCINVTSTCFFIVECPIPYSTSFKALGSKVTIVAGYYIIIITLRVGTTSI